MKATLLWNIAAALSVSTGSVAPLGRDGSGHATLVSPAHANVLRKIRRAARDVGRRVREAAEDVGQGARKAAEGVGRAAKKAGEAVKEAAEKVGEVAGKGFDFAKKIFCKTIGKTVCDFIDLAKDIIKGAKNFVERAVKHGIKTAFKMAIDDLKQALTKKIEDLKNRAASIFENFRAVLTQKEFKLASIVDFAKKTFPTLSGLAQEVLGKIMPFPWGDLMSLQLGAIGTGVLAPTLAAMAAVHFGMKKLLAFIVPKIIIGAGTAFNYVNDKLPPGFKKLVEVLMKVVGVGGPGIVAGIFSFAKPATRERLQAVFLQIANVAGRIQQGIDGALKAAQAARGGSFEEADQAFQAHQPTPSELGPEDLKKMIEGLAGFAKEQILLALESPVRRLVAAALQGMNRLLDIPRNALVAAVGSIPVAGGVLSSALNFGLGIVVDMVNNFFVEQARELVKEVVGDVVNEVQGALTAELLKSQSSQKAAQAFPELAKIVARLAGDVQKTLRAAAGGQQALFAQMIINALDNFLQRGVKNPEVRQILSQALNALSNQILQSSSGGSRFTLTQGVIAVLKTVAQPLGQLVSRRIEDPRLASLAGKALEALLNRLANETGVRNVMRNPAGFLSGVARDLLVELKPQLVDLVAGRMDDPTLKTLATRAVEKVIDEIHEKGFAGVLGLSKALAAAKEKLHSAGAKVVSTVKAAGAKILGALAAKFAEAWSRNCRSALPTLRTIVNTVGKFFTRLKPQAERVLTTLEQRCPAR